LNTKEISEANNSSQKKSSKNEIPFINKSTLDKLDNPKYKLNSEIKEENLKKFDEEAKKNKEKNKHEEANKSKIRKNLNLLNEENSKKTPKGKKGNEIEFISQAEIEKKENESGQKQKEKEKEKIPKGKKALVKREEEQNNKKTEEENDSNLNLDLNLKENENKENKENLIEKEIKTEKIKEKKTPKKNAGNKKEEIDIEKMTFETVISPEELLKKEKLENSDFILLIIEVCQNALKYGLKKSDKSKLFWDEVFNKENFSVLFKQFKPETLRKYWKIIRDSDKVSTFIGLVNRFHEKINRQNIK
jgi:hypothetical protein